jgi:aminocarboxymuconate-semialdehyde decarboxylase
MYGTDYPCWDPATALKLLDEIEMSKEHRQKLFYDNARRILGLRDPVQAKDNKARHPTQEAALA